MSRETMKGLRLVVALTTCDAERFLEPQLTSIARQTTVPHALVVGDDHSTDRTAKILNEFAQSVPFPVVVIGQSVRVGPIRNTEAVLARAAELGDVIAVADHDDVWKSDKLDAVHSAFTASAAPVLWFSDADLIDEDGDSLGRRLFDMVHLEPAEREHIRAGGGLLRLVHGETVTNPTMAIDARLVAHCLPFPDETFSGRRLYQQDGWVSVIGRVLGDVQIDDRALIAYRRHEHSVSHQEGLQPASHGETGRRHDLTRHHRRARLVASRVEARDAPWNPARREEVIALDRFLTARVGGGSLRIRLSGIGREFLSGSYHRFASGARTALFDVAASLKTIRTVPSEDPSSPIWSDRRS